MSATFDFDQIIDRRGTNCLKYDFAAERGKQADILPLWVADMDFQTAPAIRERLQKVVDHGIFGYTESKEDYFRAVAAWYWIYFGWEIKKEWLVKTPGVVFAIATAIRALTKEGDGVLIQQPVYYPFRIEVEENNRRLVVNELKEENGRYQIDFEDFEEKIVSEHVKLFIFCSPHNPVGRVWTEEELRKLGEICLKHGVVVVSDEIHSDFVFPGNRHLVFASLDERFAANTITCTSPSKSFNIAGLQISNILIPDRAKRKAFIHAIDKAGFSEINVMGLTACQAAYEEGREWLEALKGYLAENLDYVRTFLQERLPQIRLIEPEGTYLLWLDFRALGLSPEDLEDLVVKKACLWLDRGAMFGPAGEGFERINIACPRATLQEAMERLEQAVKQ